jgi:hypothetical protein
MIEATVRTIGISTEKKLGMHPSRRCLILESLKTAVLLVYLFEIL